MTMMPPRQRSLDDLGTPLREVTFCVVDLETTGTDPRSDEICEVGAVRVRGGEVLGTFQTLVNPGRALSPRITVITGLTDAVLAPAPRIDTVLPSLLEFIGDAVVVAHNARFDVGFISAACDRRNYESFSPTVVDTVTLARRLVRDEVPNCKLGTLADRFGLAHRPSHRALDDALATADLLHLLLERAAGWGVLGIDDLLHLGRLNGSPRSAKLSLTADLPREPGVYRMIDAAGTVLYVGKATNLRSRVRSYFGSDERRRVPTLLGRMHRIDHTVTGDALTAEVLERRLISTLTPEFNRVGRRRTGEHHVRLTDDDVWPRLVIGRGPGTGDALGPVPSRRAAEEIVDAIHDAFPLRRCATRIGPRFRVPAGATPCTPAQAGRTPCPCAGVGDAADYATVVDAVSALLVGDVDDLLLRSTDRMRALVSAHRFEEAAAVRDRVETLLRVTTDAAAVRALRAGGRVEVEVSGVTHVIDDGLLHHRVLDEVPCLDALAERRLLARTIQRAAEGGNVSLRGCTGIWELPVPVRDLPARLGGTAA